MALKQASIITNDSYTLQVIFPLFELSGKADGIVRE